MDDLSRFNLQFMELIFPEQTSKGQGQAIGSGLEETTVNQEEQEKLEREMKKLLTVAKSKFYMLRVNFPQVFERVEHEIVDQSSSGTEHDPLA